MNLFWMTDTVNRELSISSFCDSMKLMASYSQLLLSAIETPKALSCICSNLRGSGSSFFVTRWPVLLVTYSSISSKM